MCLLSTPSAMQDPIALSDRRGEATHPRATFQVAVLEDPTRSRQRVDRSVFVPHVGSECARACSRRGAGLHSSLSLPASTDPWIAALRGTFVPLAKQSCALGPQGSSLAQVLAVRSLAEHPQMAKRRASRALSLLLLLATCWLYLLALRGTLPARVGLGLSGQPGHLRFGMPDGT